MGQEDTSVLNKTAANAQFVDMLNATMNRLREQIDDHGLSTIPPLVCLRQVLDAILSEGNRQPMCLRFAMIFALKNSDRRDTPSGTSEYIGHVEGFVKKGCQDGGHSEDPMVYSGGLYRFQRGFA